MSAYIWKDNQQTGPFIDDVILQALSDGKFSYDDLAWREGLAEWQPLGTLYPTVCPKCNQLGAHLPTCPNSSRAVSLDSPPTPPIRGRGIVLAAILAILFSEAIYFGLRVATGAVLSRTLISVLIYSGLVPWSLAWTCAVSMARCAACMYSAFHSDLCVCKNSSSNRFDPAAGFRGVCTGLLWQSNGFF